MATLRSCLFFANCFTTKTFNPETMPRPIFLTAQWKNLVMANYEVEAAVLQPMVPAGTELDTFNGKYYVSLVGFMFLNTKLMGIPVPFHQNFEEVNLRFYVRYQDAGTWKRGVVFVKEIVPKWAISFVANTIYGEPYVTHSMRHQIKQQQNQLEVSYEWKVGKAWYSIGVTANSVVKEIEANSEEEFITEHYWGYTNRQGNYTQEYAVEHPRWQVHTVNRYEVKCDFEQLYGPTFANLNSRQPDSVLLANGSDILVCWGRKI